MNIGYVSRNNTQLFLCGGRLILAAEFDIQESNIMCTWHCFLSMKIIKYITGNERRFSIQQK